MSKMQRTKGAQFERETAATLSAELGTVVKRKLGQARDGGDDMEAGPFRIECKRRAGIAVYEWLEQCAAAAQPGQVPIVIARADRKADSIVILRLTDFIPLMRGEMGDFR